MWSSKAVANLSENWKGSIFFWQFKLEWIHLCWSALPSVRACLPERLCRANEEAKHSRDTRFFVISHASQCEVQSTTRMLARFNSETFKLGWTQAFWALVQNQQSMLKNTEYQPTLNIQNIQLLHQCWDYNSKKMLFLQRKPCLFFFFFVSGTQIHLFYGELFLPALQVLSSAS